PAFAYGGTCRVCWEIARRMARRGHSVLVHTTDAFDAHQRTESLHEVVEGVTIHRSRNLSNRLAWRRIFLPLTFGAGLEAAIRQADIVHIHEYRSLLDAIALPILKRTGTPFVISPQGSLPLIMSRIAIKRVYDVLVGRPMLKAATGLHAINIMERNQYLAAGASADKIHFAANGIDADDYKHLPIDLLFRARHNIPEAAPLVLFLARINKIKGVDFLLPAFARVARELPDAVLALVGPDDGFLAEVKRQMRELGIEDKVRYIGYLGGDDKLQAYLSSDLYVLPSTYEILGITLLEALACGAPVITTDQCGLADTIEGQRLGSVVKFGDVEALAAQMRGALLNRAASRQDAERRRAYVLNNFTWDAIADTWETIYRECARRE
ncbi:MAG TPA: glycosyltransferase, partial [Anaerolineales bacterium]|nr:glycosyltransferase [Anaerolineales bacterium]